MLGQWNIVLPCEFTSKMNPICPGQKWNTLMTSVPCRKSLLLTGTAHRSCNVSDRQDNETQPAFCALLALKAVSLQSIVHGLISTEPVPFTLEKATRFRLSGLYQVSEQVPSTPSRTALGEYPARHFIKCLQTDAF